MAKLYFRYGAMNSGKTTSLIQVAHNYEERGMSVLLVKARIDTKGGAEVATRIGLTRQVDIIADEKTNIRTEVAKRGADCVLVDEAQFLQEDQIDQLFELAVLDNIPVICYGLRTDFQRKLFPGSSRLFALAHSLEELKTICRCGKKAIFVGRKIQGEYVSEGSQVAIDGEENTEYESLCGSCYFEKVAKQE